MKLNNKGFAITAVLYGLLILFVLLVSSYLMVLSTRKNRVDNLIKDIEEEYTERIDDDNNNNSQIGEYDVVIKVTDSNKQLISGGTLNDTDKNEDTFHTENGTLMLNKVDPGPNLEFVNIECDDNNISASYGGIDDSEWRDIVNDITISNITQNTTCYIMFT